MNFSIKGKLVKLDPRRGKMASIVVKDFRKGQHWLVYLDLCKTDFSELAYAKIGCSVEASGFVTQKDNKTFFIAQEITVNNNK